MPGWLELKAKDLRRWLSSFGGNELPTFRVRVPQLTRESVEWSTATSDFSPQPYLQRRHRESGIREIRFKDNVRDFSSHFRPLLDQVVNQMEDGRKIADVQHPSETDLEVETELADLEIPVIGPGGRITVKQVRDREIVTADVDIIIRHRTDPIRSEWRDPEEIAESILRRSSDYAARPVETLFVQFGYLELSKYERQDWMRPAALVSFVALAGGDRAKWTATIAEAVTMTRNLGPLEGLGSFAE